MPFIFVYMIASIVGVMLLAVIAVIYSAVKRRRRKK